jgi:type II secretory pathway pseudopilin PulG
MFYIKSKNSFTLIELMISLVLVSIVTLVSTAFFVNNQSVISKAVDRQEIHNEAYIALKYLSRSIKNADSVDLINPSGSISSEIEIVHLDTGGGEVERLRYQLNGTDLRYYPPPYDSGNYNVVARNINSLDFSDGEDESKTEALDLVDIDITSQSDDGQYTLSLSTQAACRDRIYVMEYEWFDGQHNWEYNETDGTLHCIDEGYDWTITLEETGVLGPDVMSYLGINDGDDVNLIFADSVLTEIDGRQVVDGVVIIMANDSVAIIPPEQTTVELHQSKSNYSFDVTIAAKIGGYAPTIAFGVYTYDEEGNKVLTEAVGQDEWTGTFEAPAGVDFGFYMDVGSSGYTYYTETAENPDGFDHAWEYVSDALGTLVLGWEDLYGGGDEDHQDFVVTVTPTALAD